MLNYPRVYKRFTEAKKNKAKWENLIRDCYRYALPERNLLDNYDVGQTKKEYVFDDTAKRSVVKYADTQIALLVPPATKWMKLKAGSEIPEEEVEKAEQYLEKTTDTLFEHINSSNFTSQMHDAFIDLSISTGAIIVEEGDGIQSGLNFRAIPLAQLVIEQSTRGLIDTVWREFKLPAQDILYTWNRAKLPSVLTDLIDKKPTDEVAIIEGVIYENGKYTSVVMYPEQSMFILEEELEYSPYVVFREDSISGETYGRGRVMTLLQDIKTLNLMKKNYLMSLTWYSTPTFTATDDGVSNPYTRRIRPGSVNPVQSNDNGSLSLRPVQVSGMPQLLEKAIKDIQYNIQETLLGEPYGDVNEQPVRTATEMSIRNSEKAQARLSASSRVQTECLERIAANCIHILKKQGKVGEFKVNGREVRVKFINPATRQQDEAMLAAYGRFGEMMMALGLTLDVVAQKIKVEDTPTEIWDLLGLPENLKRNEEEVARMQKQQATQQQAAMEQGGQNGAQS